MTDPVKEQLSACLDGELPEAELDLLLKQVQRDPRLQQSVTRYGLIGEVLRTGTAPAPSAGFASRISQAVAAETTDPSQQPAAAAAARGPMPRWVRPAGGAAIAAGVAAVAVMVLQPQINTWQQGDVATQVADAKAPGYVVPPSTPTTQIVPAAYLAKYVMAHSEYAGPLGRRAVLSSVLADDEGELGDTVDVGPPADANPTDMDTTDIDPTDANDQRSQTAPSSPSIEPQR